MTQSTFTNFKYQVDKISLRNRRGVTVTFDYNGEPVKRILVFKEREGVSYVDNAKRVIEREYRNGQLEKYAKKYVRHNNKSGKSPVMPILVGTLAVAALALTGVVAYKAFTSNSGGGGGGDPTVNYYMVDFDTNGGSYTKSQKIESGKLVTKPADPTKKEGDFSYTFDGWWDAKEGGNKWDFGATTITTDKTIYAHWTGTPPTPSTYHTVSFDTQGGSFVEAQQIQEGGKVTKPADPTKTEGTFSYTFAEWWTAPTGGTKWDFDKNTISGDTVIYAHWTGTPPTPTESYTVDFDTNNGSYIKSQKIEKGGHVTKPDPDPTKTEGTFSYTFGGWWDAKDGGNPWDFGVNTITGDTTIYAHWTGTPPTPPTYYTVSFDSQGGSFVPSQQIEDGGKATEPANPTRTEGTFSYTFDGWWDAQSGGTEWDFGNTVSGNKTLYAHWTGTPPTYYQVDFNTLGGSSVPSQQIEEGGHVTKPADPTRTEGDYEYEFKGWFKSATGDEVWDFDSDTVTSQTIIYAHWGEAPTYYTVTFNTQGGSHVDSETVEAGEHATQPADPTKLGWKFNGWWNQQEGGSPWNFAEDAITGNTTIYAHWLDTERTITFDDQNGTGTTHEVKVRVDEHLIAPDTPVYAGHTFNGWFDAATGGTKFDFTKVFTEEMLPESKLYAQWTANQIVINVDPNGGTFEDGSTEIKQLLGFDTETTWGKVKDESAIEIETMPEGATSYSYQYYNMLDETPQWEPIPGDDFKITSDLSVKVVYTYDATSFVNDSWEVFTSYLNGKNFNEITATTAPYYEEYHGNGDTFVGLTRALTINGMPYHVRVIGENNENNGGLFTFEFVETLNLETPYSLDSDNNSYKDSYINNFLNKSFFFSLPSSLQSAIRMRDASYYDAVTETSVHFSTKLFVLSAAELKCGSTFPDGTSTEYENEAYSYYATGGSRIKKNLAGEAINYWTRSADRTGSLETAWNINPTGALGDINGQSVATDSAMYIAPVFNIF